MVVASIIFSCRNAERKTEESLSVEMEAAVFQMAIQYFRPLESIDLSEYNPQQQILAELGKKLFYDKNLSFDRTISCASCHIIEQFGVDNLAVSPGDIGQPVLAA